MLPDTAQSNVIYIPLTLPGLVWSTCALTDTPTTSFSHTCITTEVRGTAGFLLNFVLLGKVTTYCFGRLPSRALSNDRRIKIPTLIKQKVLFIINIEIKLIN